MLDRLFGMGRRPRERLYELFRWLPRPMKAVVLESACGMTQRRLVGRQSPSRLIFYATNRCNMACEHCFYHSHLNRERADELSLAEIRQVAASIKEPLQLVTLTGGEPFLREDLADIVGIFDRENRTRAVTLPTNGSFPEATEKTVKRMLADSGLRLNLQVSLDGLAATHDKLRGATGAFDKATETVRRFAALANRSAGVNAVSVLTVVSRANLEELPALMTFVSAMPDVFHKIQFVRSVDHDVFDLHPACRSDLAPPQNDAVVLDEADRRRAFCMVREALQEREDTLLVRRQILGLALAMEILAGRHRVMTCLAGNIDGVVYPNGGVAVCEMTRPFANLRDFDMDFDRLWHSPEAAERRAQTTACACTHPCNLATSAATAPDILLALSESRAGWQSLVERVARTGRWQAKAEC